MSTKNVQKMKAKAVYLSYTQMTINQIHMPLKSINQIIIFTLVLLSYVANHSFAQDSLSMRKMAQIDTMGTEHNDIWGYKWGAKEYAVVGSNTKINIVDVSDCGAPEVVHQWEDPSTVTWRDFKDYRDYVYAICDGTACSEGLQTINKNTFEQYSSTTDFTRAHNLFVDQKAGRLYVAGSNTNHKGLSVFDLTEDPQKPTLIKKVNFQTVTGTSLDWYVHDVYVRNDTAYCSHGAISVSAAWDMSDLDNVEQLYEWETPDGGYNHSSWLDPEGDYEYMVRETWGEELIILDVSDFSNVDQVGSFQHNLHTPIGEDASMIHNPFVHLDRLFLSHYHDGVKVLDISDRENPELIAYYDTYNVNNGDYDDYRGCWGIYPFLPSGCIVASDIQSGFYSFRLLLPPTRDAIFDTDIILNVPGAGIFFRTNDNHLWKYNISTGGSLLKTLVVDEPANKIEFKNTNVKLTAPSSGIILRNPIGEYYKLTVSVSGAVSATPILAADLPTTASTIMTEEMYLSQHSAGLKLTAPDGTCHMIRILSGGLTGSELVPCD